MARSSAPDDHDHRAILGVGPGASEAEIKQAYRRRAKEIHPDANPSAADATDEMRSLNEAYEALCETARPGPPPDLEPAEIDFGVVPPGPPGSTVTVLVRGHGGILDIVDVVPRQGEFWSLDTVASQVPGVLVELRIRVRVPAGLPRGRHTERVLVRVDSAGSDLLLAVTVPGPPAGSYRRELGVAGALALGSLLLLAAAVLVPLATVEYVLPDNWRDGTGGGLLGTLAGGLYVAAQLMAPLYVVRYVYRCLRRLAAATARLAGARSPRSVRRTPR